MKAKSRWLLLLLPFTLPLLTSACLRSRLHITTDPPGAEVIWRGAPYGATPITIPFIWYWYYDFTLQKPGYQSEDHLERLRTPPWFLMPFDLLLEVIPVPIPDNRYRHYVLKPKPPGEAAALAAQDIGTTGTTPLAPPPTLPPTNATPNSIAP